MVADGGSHQNEHQQQIAFPMSGYSEMYEDGRVRRTDGDVPEMMRLVVEEEQEHVVVGTENGIPLDVDSMPHADGDERRGTVMESAVGDDAVKVGCV